MRMLLIAILACVLAALSFPAPGLVGVSLSLTSAALTVFVVVRLRTNGGRR